MSRIHFIGIGGIGVSSLARFFLSHGEQVSGSDLAESDLLEELKKEGVEIYNGHYERNIHPDVGRVIYSAAVKTDNPELKTAREYGIRTQSYAQALGEITKEYYTIAVSGSHGKSTTTAMLALILEKAKLDPTVIIGTKLREWKGKNFRKGKSKYLVIEADEWNRSFHEYHPQIAVITNIDNEHLDTYNDFKGVVSGFEKYIDRIPENGYLIANAKDKALFKIAKALQQKKNMRVVLYNEKKFQEHNLQVPGIHNQVNAEAAWQVAKLLGVQRSTAEAVFNKFTGTWRRMERLKVLKKTGFSSIIMYSDYAHHPTEIQATLAALRSEYPKACLICVFEPHQQDRLTRLFNDFVRSFKAADKAVILPFYKVAGREAGNGKDSFDLAQAMKHSKPNTFFAPDFDAAIKLIKNENTRAQKVVVFMGAGDIDTKIRKFLTE